MPANTWIRALKIWNKDKPKYTVPKKGTKDHKEVMQISNKLKTSKTKSK